jgi:Metallo-beta-lactamase superfamily
MRSSNSGSQRLSQTALSRSHFLRFAAGVLFPFVGWRLPAAAEPPELAQNSSGPETKQAAGRGRTGAILVSQFGPVKIHSYLSPADGLQVNTQMIEGPNVVVIFDGQLLLPYADEVASYVQTLGKPIDRIILSHAHTDHWGGLQVLTERFTDARVFALDGIADPMAYAGLTATGPLRKSPSRRRQITEGPQRIDGVTYHFRRFVAICRPTSTKFLGGRLNKSTARTELRNISEI